MRKIFAALILFAAAQAEAKLTCTVFVGAGMPKEVRDLFLVADRDASKSLFRLVARNFQGRPMAGGSFLCEPVAKDLTSCKADDDAGGFYLSWEDEYSLQSDRFSLQANDGSGVDFLPRGGSKPDDKIVVFYGKDVPCRSSERKAKTK